MSARSELAVVLSDDEGDELRVEFDVDAVQAEQVDIRAKGQVVLSCSLDEVQAFADLLLGFVDHHRPPDCADCANAEPGMGCAACGKPV